jgi:general nucleoside transport system permease protein
VTGVTAFLDSTVRMATPLFLAAAGELLVERSGIINIGLEGILIGGAFGALVGATHGAIAGGVIGALVGGVLVSLLFLGFVVIAGTDQIVTGTAVTLFALGATGALYRALYGSTGAALTIPTLAPAPIPLLSRIPVIGAPLFAQPVVTYLAYALVPALWWWMYRTHAGLALRAIGESPSAATAAGISIRRFRSLAIVVQGMLGGLAGGTLVLAQAGTFAEGMSAGRGFIAIAIVVLGRWHPIGVAVAALVFGAASALQFAMQALGLGIPYQVVLAVPYVLTLCALAGVAGRVRAPAGLGREAA